MSGSGETPVRIVRKKAKGHGGGHGGAWKVAYADFVTAMMALFITLWIVSMNESVKKSVAAYFEDPVKFTKEHSGESSKPTDAHDIHPPKNPATPSPSIDQLKTEMEKLRNEAFILEDLISKDATFRRFKDQIKIVLTEEGLRIELQEKSSNEGVFFDLSSATLKKDAEGLISMLSREIGKMNNPVIVEGHTDSNPYLTTSYSNWDLSTDRANSARKVLEVSLKKGQLTEVRGYADRKLRNPSKPLDYSNRRISILIKPNLNAPKNAKGSPIPQTTPSGAGHGHTKEPPVGPEHKEGASPSPASPPPLPGAGGKGTEEHAEKPASPGGKQAPASHH